MKDVVKLYKELKKSPRGKAILFFSFYFVFFVILAIIARISPEVSLKEEPKPVDDTLSISNINGVNYQYTYEINVDSYTAYVEGKKKGYEEELTYTFGDVKNKYYKNGLAYYNNGALATIPNEHIQIIDNIDLLINNATYDSTTDYQSGRQVKRYLISSSTISSLLLSKELDIEEIPNEIVVTESENRIPEVELRLDSYCKALQKCNESMSIKINYSNFGEVDINTNATN